MDIKTVEELIEFLSQFPKDTKVQSYETVLLHVDYDKDHDSLVFC